MFEIRRGEGGELVLSGRFDAAQSELAERTFAAIVDGTVVDMHELLYISSLGLGILVKTQKRLRAAGAGGLRIVNPRKHVRDLFRFAGLEQIFEIEASVE